MLKEICSDLFGAHTCPKKIIFFNKGCMYPNVRYILTYEDNEKGYSFKLWSLFNQRCDCIRHMSNIFRMTVIRSYFQMACLGHLQLIGCFRVAFIPRVKIKKKIID